MRAASVVVALSPRFAHLRDQQSELKPGLHAHTDQLYHLATESGSFLRASFGLSVEIVVLELVGGTLSQLRYVQVYGVSTACC